MATITYRRVRQREGKLVKIRVSHNGVRVGSVSLRGHLVVEVEPGVHAVEVSMQGVRARTEVTIATDDDQVVVTTGMASPFALFVDACEPGSIGEALTRAEGLPTRPWWGRFERLLFHKSLFFHPPTFVITFIPAAVAFAIDGGEISNATLLLGVILIVEALLNVPISTWIVRRGARGS